MKRRGKKNYKASPRACLVIISFRWKTQTLLEPFGDIWMGGRLKAGRDERCSEAAKPLLEWNELANHDSLTPYRRASDRMATKLLLVRAYFQKKKARLKACSGRAAFSIHYSHTEICSDKPCSAMWSQSMSLCCSSVPKSNIMYKMVYKTLPICSA